MILNYKNRMRVILSDILEGREVDLRLGSFGKTMMSFVIVDEVSVLHILIYAL